MFRFFHQLKALHVFQETATEVLPTFVYPCLTSEARVLCGTARRWGKCSDPVCFGGVAVTQDQLHNEHADVAAVLFLLYLDVDSQAPPPRNQRYTL